MSKEPKKLTCTENIRKNYSVIIHNYFYFRPTISSSVLKSRAHRERSQTQNTKKLSNLALSKQQESEKIDEARKVSSNSTKDGGFSATKQQTNNQIGYFILIVIFY